MMSQRFEASLFGVECLLERLAAQLVEGDAPAVQTSSTALRLAMIDLSNASSIEPVHALQQVAVRTRLTQVSLALARQREQLARRAVVVDRSLASVLPVAAQATYGGAGDNARFKGSSARIYAAAAN